MSLQVKLLSSSARVPTRASPKSAGYDLYAAHEATIDPCNGNALIKTDIAASIPEGFYGRIAPRSGLALKHKINVGGGVVDADYRGNIGVILFNHGEQPFTVEEGDRIAQLIIERCWTGELEVIDELSETRRDEGGFGSTGR